MHFRNMALLSCFIVVLLSVSVLSDNPTVRIISTDPIVDEIEGIIIQQKGKDVQMTCVVENKPGTTEVQWTVQNYRQNGSTIQIATATRSYDAFKWAIDKPSTTAWRLRIQNAQITSEGIYTCKVEVASQIPVQEQRELRVVEKPKIADLMTSTDMYFDAGDSAKLECYATGHPQPTVVWTRLAGELLPIGGTALQSNVLTIDAIKADHAGVYKCTATNSAGKDERRILISVNFSPVVSASTPLVKQKVGYVKQLVCNIKGDPLPSPEQISWTRENVPIRPSARLQIRNIPGAYNRITSILDIRGVQESDFGRYTCTATVDRVSAHAYMEMISSDVPTKDRSNRIVSGSPALVLNIFLSTLMLFTVIILHQLQNH